MLILPETPLPPKPRHGETCNGCGLCCAVEICAAGRIVHPEREAPCPELVFADGRTYCRLVLVEKESALQPLIAKALGIGQGCSMEDDA